MSDIAIKIENLTKLYKLYNLPIDRLKESLHPFRKQYHKGFYAINDISFDILKGESVGIIGKNGSGKSTLLKIITGVLTPTSGLVQVNGKISALLELGAGFNPELTGTENVYFSGMLMGYTRDEMDDRLDDILSFADIGEFVNQPVRTFSSGMFVRLAFAVAVNVEPEILIVDEALSVGDVFFQQKCFSKIKRMIDSNITTLFVSHDMVTMQKICKRGIMLSEGHAILDTDSVTCASAYYMPDYNRLAVCNVNSKDICNVTETSNKLPGKILYDKNTSSSKTIEQGDKLLEIEEVTIESNDKYQAHLVIRETIIIRLRLRANADIAVPNVGISIIDSKNSLIFCSSAYQLKHHLPPLKRGSNHEIAIRTQLPLHPGEYTLTLGCSEIPENDFSKSLSHHRLIGLGPLTIDQLVDEPMNFDGIVELPIEFI